MILLIDNYDSFTYNIVQYLAQLGAEVVVRRNDEVTLEEISSQRPDKIVLSPGPGNPDSAGVTCDVIRTFGASIPMLGICLGHQAIGQVFGADVVRAKEVMHGKTSKVFHHDSSIFGGLDSPLTVTRYHSLIVEESTLPEELEITAWTQTPEGDFDTIMGLAHKTLPIHGVQFHPEAVLTECGHELFSNFLTRVKVQVSR